MKQFLNYFKFFFLAIVIVFVVWVGVMIKSMRSTEDETVRVNNVCTETERVFDYGEVLTNEEEESLRELIAEKELEAKCDIILMTMNESLEEYAKEYDPYASGNDFTMIKADNFYDENGFGWNKYQESDDGDGIILLDNWYREADSNVYTWVSTSGAVEHTYSSRMIDELLDDVYRYIETDPYEAYKAYVNAVARQMNHPNQRVESLPWAVVFVVPLVIAIVFCLINYTAKAGKKTVIATTYVEGGKPQILANSDIFIRKTVSQRHIERSSSSGGGGGGHHTSSGGHSHGGGGRSR